ncbi:MAG: DUF234 domain-containing protein [Campylobacterota bacterium]
MQTAIKYFSVFGGYDIDIDTTKPLDDLIKKHILNNYENIKKEVHLLTGGYHIDHAILSAIALSDRRTNSSFKRAHVSFEEGMTCVDNLCDKGIIEIESSFNFLAKKVNNSEVSKKLLFTTSFLRFWFAFVSPIYKGIKDKKYKEFNERFNNNFTQFQEFIFEELCMEYTRDFYEKDGIKDLGKYWDKTRQIDVIAQTKENKIIAGVCKNTNSKIKKAVLTKLIKDCKDIGLEVDIFVLFANNGFSSELKAMKSNTLRLFNAKSLKLLIRD